MSEERPIVLWGRDDDEFLTHTELHDATEAQLEYFDDQPFPETIEVCGFARMTATIDSELIIENLLERLDGDYGGESEFSEPTPAMRAAARVFVAAVLAEYIPWRCELVKRETVNVREWVSAHRPDWLEDEGALQ